MDIQANPLLLDEFAQKLHQSYRDHVTFTGGASDPESQRDWDSLSPALQSSNRVTVQQTCARFPVLGLNIASQGTPEALGVPADLDADIELLAELGHCAWSNRYRVTGWEFSPVGRSRVAGTHPALIPWKILPEPEREKERILIRTVVRLLEDSGYLLVVGPGIEHQGMLDAALTERIAEALHEAYLASHIARRVTVFDNAALRPWASLPPTWQNANRGAARRIETWLEAAGLAIAPADPPPAHALTVADWEQYIDPFAQLAHRDWMRERFAEGWQRGGVAKNLQNKTHPDLVPWADLPDASRERNREEIRSLWGILGEAGLTVVGSTRYQMPAESPPE